MDTHDNLILQSVRAEQERLQNDMSLAYQVYSQVANQLQVAALKYKRKTCVCSGGTGCCSIESFRIRFESLCFTICIFICFWYYKLDIDGEEYI